MNLNIKQVTKLTGLTSKTLRHWEKVGLLKAQRLENDYRSYNEDDLTRIFYITSLRRFDLPLEAIKKIILEQTDEKTALAEHLSLLKRKQEELFLLIENLSEKLEKEDYQMSEKDFDLLKKEQIAKNEAQYGAEIRAKYGEKVIDDFNQKFLSQSQKEMEEKTTLHDKIVEMIESAYEKNDEKLAQEAVQLHQNWIKSYWGAENFSPEAHLGLFQMYCDDERFRANYNKKHADLPEYFQAAAITFYKTNK